MTKFLIIEFKKKLSGGLGDRIVGLVSAIQIANITNRKLVIKWDTSDLENNFNFDNYNFKKLSFEKFLTVTSINCIDNQNIMKNIIRKEDLIDYWKQYDIVVITCNCNLGQYLYQNPNFKDRLISDDNFISYSKDIRTIYQDIYKKYLKSNSKIEEKINNFLIKFNNFRSNGKKVVGIQIRTGDKYFDNNGVEIVPNNNLENIISYFRDLLEEKMKLNSNQVAIFLCYDNTIVENIFKSMFDNYNILFYSAPIIHIDKYSTNNKNSINNRNNIENGFEKVIIDQILLSRTDYLLISNSNLARCAYLMSENTEGYCLRYNKNNDQYEVYELTTEYASSKQMNINIWDNPSPKYIYGNKKSSSLEIKNIQYQGPIKDIPSELLDAYTLNGQIPIADWYIDESKPKYVDWNKQYVNEFLDLYNLNNVINNKIQGKEPYPNASKLHCVAFNKYPLSSKSVAVIGSLTPWIESLAINHNAKSVTTVEYNVPKCDHHMINTMSYNEFEKGNYKFDVIISYSSIEHSGLGRYGDPLDPEGDIKAMNTIYKSLDDNGVLLWGSPVGQDCLTWNAHRIYGKIRFPLLFKKFEILEWIGCDETIFDKAGFNVSCYQPLVVAKKIELI